MLKDFFFILLAIAVNVLIGSLAVMLLWNFSLVSAIPVVSKIGFFESCGIYMLSAVLFKSNIDVKLK